MAAVVVVVVAVVVPGAAALTVPAVIPEVLEVVQVLVVLARSHRASLPLQAARIMWVRRAPQVPMDLEVVSLRDRRKPLELVWMCPISAAPETLYRRR